jgi:type II secretory pathway component PulJ
MAASLRTLQAFAREHSAMQEQVKTRELELEAALEQRQADLEQAVVREE